MKAFVTGGSGFVGKSLIRYLLSRGHAVVALSRTEQSDSIIQQIDANIQIVRGDLSSIASTHVESCDVVFHLAAQVNPRAPLAEMQRNNVDGTRLVIEAAKAADVPRFVLLSTCSVYVKKDHAPLVNVKEDDNVDPPEWAVYAYTKKLAEDVVVAANIAVSLKLLLDTVWGPGLVNAVKNGALRRFEPSGYSINTTHIENLCEGLLLSAEKGRPGNAYNIVDSDKVVFEEFVEQYVHAQDSSLHMPNNSISFDTMYNILWLLEWIPFASSLLPVNREILVFAGQEYTVNSHKARQELGYVGHISREEGLEKVRRYRT
ncbi:NAD(P)-binding protein [Rhizoclosmatium globosum]|uniref:NAD(P)-binding protein n=1 Tax=Rhizoclosmatium globosum TaxID=329046 RepID=A0A1Y2CKD4_9FUNG|nr:NAD(P)-binding protein [Rhizoclosmatium globosum]|eukprot:ORY46795.1 NAD(P)-binding protein [Rhizoclosmatium globosum]